MVVKVCGITRREDAEAAVEAGATALGFIFFKPSPRYVAPEKVRELGAGLDVWKTGVFVDDTADEIEAIIQTAHLDIAQIYSDATPQRTRIWRAKRCDAGSSLQRLSHGTPANSDEALFLDSAGNGIAFDWTLARNLGEKVIIAGGLDASNVQDAIRIAQPWGVDASSRLEIAPGIKDHEKMRRFIQAARETS
jgi:phosphoribosylanthranilate isomerase